VSQVSRGRYLKVLREVNRCLSGDNYLGESTTDDNNDVIIDLLLHIKSQYKGWLVVTI
jgi:hypothetical protein